MRGHVILYDAERGFGYIRPDDGAIDVRVEEWGIVNGEGPGVLERYQLVAFEIIDGEPNMDGTRRKQAVNVRVIE